VDLFRVMRAKGQMKALAQAIAQDAELEQFVRNYQSLLEA
jgi:hypothetical protein